MKQIKALTALFITTMMMTSCHSRVNPFLCDWDTPQGIPPYSLIEESDYLPAIEAGIAQQEAEIQAIIDNPEAPGFDNVLGAYEQSGEILEKVTGVLFNLSESDATESLLAIVEKALPMLSGHSDNILMNPELFRKVDALYQQKDALGLSTEQQMLLKKIHNSFIRNGIALNGDDQQRLREINTEISRLELTFGNNLLAESNAFRERFGISVSEYTTEMTYCEDRDRREQMFNAYSSRGNNGNEYDNNGIVLKIMQLRIEKAQLLGFANPAEFILDEKMASRPETVDDFLQSIFEPASARAREEVMDMQAIMDQDILDGKLPAGSRIQPWDWFYYAEKVRKAKFDLDEEQTKPYFQMEKVREGVFSTASRLYGLSFEKMEDAPLYHPEVEVFKVNDSDGSLLGILMTDYFPRDTKRGGAWMNNVRSQRITPEGENIRPIIVNVGNFTKPTADKPSLLTIDEVETMFHEFGHALHGLLTQCHYPDVSGTSVAQDFVELFSQINENWAFEKEVLSGYARHYQTDEVIPDALIEKITQAADFNQGFMTTELAAASILDMKWHELSSVYVPADDEIASETPAPDDNSLRLIDVAKFEKKVCREMGLIDEIIPRYRSTYFNHIFNNGYCAGYYGYLWSEVLDKDAFELFKEKGIFDAGTAASFRHNLIEKGGSDEPMKLYVRFRGAEPDPGALLRARGIAGDKE